MHDDPIVAETRKLREEMQAEVGNDLDALIEFLKKRESLHPERLVNFPARRPAVVASGDRTPKSGG